MSQFQIASVHSFTAKKAYFSFLKFKMINKKNLLLLAIYSVFIIIYIKKTTFIYNTAISLCNVIKAQLFLIDIQEINFFQIETLSNDSFKKVEFLPEFHNILSKMLKTVILYIFYKKQLFQSYIFHLSVKFNQIFQLDYLMVRRVIKIPNTPS